MSYFVTYKRVERSQGLIFFPFLFALVKLLFPSMSLYQESDPVCERFFSFFRDRAKRYGNGKSETDGNICHSLG